MKKLFALFLMCSTAMAAGPLLWGPDDTSKNLQSNFNLKDTWSFLQGDDDPQSVAKSAPKGSIYCRTGSSGGSCYTKQDSGSSTNWTSMAGSTPGGSNTEVQFNDSGAFGADSSFIWDKTNDRIGVQVESPQVPIHAASVTATTVSDVTAGSASLLSETLPTAPTGSVTAIAEPAAGSGGGGINFVNPGAGSAITANGATYYFRIYPVMVASSGVNYRSQFYEEYSFGDPNDFQSYDIQVGWGTVSISGETVNYYVEYSTDGFSYSTLGLSSNTTETYTSLSGSASTTAWPSQYVNSSGSAVNYDFGPYGYSITPGGGSVYSSAGTTYTATIPSDGLNYIFKHTFTGGSANWKIVAPQASPSNAKNLTGTYYDVGFSTWGDSTTTTPASYGFSGTDQDRDYKIYSFNTTYQTYSSTPYIVSTTAEGGVKYVSGSYTLPSGITQVKILRQINGGGYTAGKLITSGTTFTDDSTDTGWDAGTTVTPTSVVGGTARLDKSLTTLTQEAQLAIVDTTGSGTRYSKISFGIASNSSSAPTYQTHIYSTSSTSYLNLVATRVEFPQTLGGTSNVIIGNSNVFNNASSSSVHFQVKGQADASLINTRSDQNTVGFGQAIGTDRTSTIQIQPTLSTDKAITFIGHSGMTASSEMLKFMNSSGTVSSSVTMDGTHLAPAGSASSPGFSFYGDADNGMFKATTNELAFATGGTERIRVKVVGSSPAVGIGVTSPTAKLHLAAGTTTASSSPIKLTSGSLLTTAEAGAEEFLTDKRYFTITTGAARKEYTLNDAALTSGRVPFATTNGRLTDDSDFTFATDTLTATKVVAPTSIQVGGGTVITNITSGVATPTLTNTTNLDASTPSECQYMRVGPTVTVSCQFDIDPTAPGAILMGVSLPVSSNFGNVFDGAGTCNAMTIVSESFGLEADPTNDRVSVRGIATDVTNHPITCSFSYQII